MAGTYEFDWWRVAVRQLTDDQLEQVASGLGNETERSLSQQAVAVHIMHDEAVRSLAQRSRSALANQGEPHDYEPGDEQHTMAGDPDCRVCGETRRTCEGPR